ncbi:MAG: DUF2339 domain-containing protein [Sphingobacteriaceae bacterium]|nr:DUF2339 domain-containing protein [Sphingobacteriaceae bacterium]
MDFIILLLLIVVIVLILQQRSSFSETIERLEMRVLRLQEIIENLDASKESGPKAIEKSDPPVAVKQQPVQETAVRPQEVEKTPELEISPVPEVTKTPEPIPVFEKQPIRPSYVPPPEQEPELSFFERYPDLEKFIGENLVNKIGIAILVLSIGYFVKYAIDANWIGEIGRVAIGIVCGGILIGFAHKLKDKYNAFSSVLVGGGLAVFYFTITLAFHQFHLFSQLTAFIILIIVTSFAVALSLLYNKQELAVIALVGGFLSPFMLSTGTANYNGLFLYLVILNIGLLIIAYYKSWRILNIIAFALTVMVFTAVLFRLTAPTYHLGFIYATIFYLLYFAINIAYNVRENRSFIASDFSILLINTALYFSVGLYLLTQMHYEQYRGLFSAGLGVVNLCLSYILFRNKKVDTNVLFLLIGITLTFISLTAPIQLKGNHITLFWASEAVLLYWLYLKSDIKLTRITALIIWVAMLISLVMDWVSIYSNGSVLPILANKGFITTVFSAIATFILALLVHKDTSLESEYQFKIPRNTFRITALAVLFLAGLFEVNHQFNTRYPQGLVTGIYLMLYVSAFILMFKLLSDKLISITLFWTAKALAMAAAIAMYFLYYSSFLSAQEYILETRRLSPNHFAAHWISSVFIAVLFYHLVRVCRENMDDNSLAKSTWLICGSIVLFLSLDINLASNMLFYSKAHSINEVQRVYIKTGLPVLWGVLSFSMMWLGMNFKDRNLRIISLSLFSFTLLKLFLFDIRNIPAAGKIVAFFCLGVLLLIVSFMYQRVKQIIVADEEHPEV